jgi:hypothetical protein
MIAILILKNSNIKGRKEYSSGQNFNPTSKSSEFQSQALKQTFGTMDFSTRNMLNHQIIQNLQNSSDVTLSELSDQHIDKNESSKMIQNVFQLDALNNLENANEKGNSHAFTR